MLLTITRANRIYRAYLSPLELFELFTADEEAALATGGTIRRGRTTFAKA